MIGIIDLGISNIRNICRFFDQIKKNYIVIQNIRDFNRINILILPGVGSFGSGIEKLKKKDFFNNVINHCKNGKLLIGVCLGMQLMMKDSDESEGILGLELFNNSIKKLNFNLTQKKIHVGWNKIQLMNNNNDNFFNKFNDKDFYFTHSFFLNSIDANCFAKTRFNDEDLISFFVKENIVGCQFHLELSGRNGFDLMKQILRYEKKL